VVAETLRLRGGSSASPALQPPHGGILFCARAHPRELGKGDVNRSLTDLAVKENVVASTQNQALAALLFLYERVLERPLDRIEGVVRARKPKRLPVGADARGGGGAAGPAGWRSTAGLHAAVRLGAETARSPATARPCNCASRTSTSAPVKSPSGMAKARRIG